MSTINPQDPSNNQLDFNNDQFDLDENQLEIIDIDAVYEIFNAMLNTETSLDEIVAEAEAQLAELEIFEQNNERPLMTIVDPATDSQESDRESGVFYI